MKTFTSLIIALFLAACGGGEEEAGGLSADERQRLENIADRLDAESAEVRDILEENALDDEAPPPAGNAQ